MKVRFENGEVGEFMSWVVVERQIYAMVLRYGKFHACEYSSIETTHEPGDHSGEPDITKPLPEPDYKQANIALVNEIMARQEKALERTLNATSGIDFTYWKGHKESIEDIIQWINEHNPKGGE